MYLFCLLYIFFYVSIRWPDSVHVYLLLELAVKRKICHVTYKNTLNLKAETLSKGSKFNRDYWIFRDILWRIDSSQVIDKSLSSASVHTADRWPVWSSHGVSRDETRRFSQCFQNRSVETEKWKFGCVTDRPIDFRLKLGSENICMCQTRNVCMVSLSESASHDVWVQHLENVAFLWPHVRNMHRLEQTRETPSSGPLRASHLEVSVFLFPTVR